MVLLPGVPRLITPTAHMHPEPSSRYRACNSPRSGGYTAGSATTDDVACILRALAFAAPLGALIQILCTMGHHRPHTGHAALPAMLRHVIATRLATCAGRQ